MANLSEMIDSAVFGTRPNNEQIEPVPVDPQTCPACNQRADVYFEKNMYFKHNCGARLVTITDGNGNYGVAYDHRYRHHRVCGKVYAYELVLKLDDNRGLGYVYGTPPIESCYGVGEDSYLYLIGDTPFEPANKPFSYVKRIGEFGDGHFLIPE
jgi:hypothetical protein